MSILYSIPVSVISNNGSMKCTIPKIFIEKLKISKGEKILWVLYTNGKIEIKTFKK